MSEIWAGIRKEDPSHTPAGPDRQETMRTISQLDRICFMDLGGGCRKPTPHNCEELFLGARPATPRLGVLAMSIASWLSENRLRGVVWILFEKNGTVEPRQFGLVGTLPRPVYTIHPARPS